jgi:5-methylcytosine-specific restriction endonuclease McrA
MALVGEAVIEYNEALTESGPGDVWSVPGPGQHLRGGTDMDEDRRSYTMREPCRFCGEATAGFLTPAGGQNVIRCAECGRAVYNAPKWETGEAVRSLATRPDIKVSTRTRILERDGGTCVACHRDDVPLDVGHLLSVVDGRALGATDAELWHDDNLASMCESCNSGFSGR